MLLRTADTHLNLKIKILNLKFGCKVTIKQSILVVNHSNDYLSKRLDTTLNHISTHQVETTTFPLHFHA